MLFCIILAKWKKYSLKETFNFSLSAISLNVLLNVCSYNVHDFLCIKSAHRKDSFIGSSTV